MAPDEQPTGHHDGAVPGCLWIVATPIGTVGDLSPRAAATLAGAGLVLAEDTRQLARLLRAAGIELTGRTLSFHEHNEERRLAEVIRAIEHGDQVVLTSDAGTPVLSDPGFLLVREVRRRGLPVCSVPGPSAFSTALAASGQPPLPATLGGFLPPRRGARKKRLQELAQAPGSLVLFLSPHRLRAELADAAEVLGPERSATLLAELSKLHERAVMASLGELTGCPETANPRGEYVLVVGPPAGPAASAGEAVDPPLVRVVYREAVRRGLGRREALRWTAARLGLSQRRTFELLDQETGQD